MRTRVIAGNWKMNKNLAEAADLLHGILQELPALPPGVQALVSPPFVALALAADILKGSDLRLGAQNMSEHDDGAYTGEVSWRMLLSAGCDYVILGHSERRQYFGETDDLINRKAKKALANGLRPILCVGETLQQREKGVTGRIVTGQVQGVLEGLSPEEMNRTIIAYEPVWAIGTGRNATPAQAQEVHALIRRVVSETHGRPVAEELIIQYGGSVKADNAADLLRQNDIDGALVGGACLNAVSFASIVKAATG